MSSSNIYLNAIPLLPLTTTVYMPGQSAQFEVDPRPYCRKLFEFCQKEANNQVAIAYPIDENGSDSGPIRHVVTVMTIEYCSPVIRKGELWSWEIEAVNGRRAEIIEEIPGEDFRLAILRPLDEPDITLTPSEKLRLLLPIWIGLRLLSGYLDSEECVLPSQNSLRFAEYYNNIATLLYRLYIYLPLTYRDKVDYFAAKDIFEKAQLTARFVSKAREAKFPYDPLPKSRQDLLELFPHGLPSRN